MQKRQQETFTRFTNVARFCRRHASRLQPMSAGFEGQMHGLDEAIKTLDAAQRIEGQSSNALTVQLGEAKLRLYERVLSVARLARIVNQQGWPKVAVKSPQSKGKLADLLRIARYMESEASVCADAFMACGAAHDFLAQLQEAIARVDQLQALRDSARSEQMWMRKSVRSAIKTGRCAVVGLDAIVGAYYKRDEGRRSAMWQQWRAIVPVATVPYVRRRTRSVREETGAGGTAQ